MVMVMVMVMVLNPRNAISNSLFFSGGSVWYVVCGANATSNSLVFPNYGMCVVLSPRNATPNSLFFSGRVVWCVVCDV